MKKELLVSFVALSLLLSGCSSGQKAESSVSSEETTAATEAATTTTAETLYKPVPSEVSISKAEYLVDSPISKIGNISTTVTKDYKHKVYIRSIPDFKPEEMFDPEAPDDDEEHFISSEEYCKRYGVIELRGNGTEAGQININISEETKDPIVKRLQELKNTSQETDKELFPDEQIHYEIFDTVNKNGINVFGYARIIITYDEESKLYLFSYSIYAYSCVDENSVVCYNMSVYRTSEDNTYKGIKDQLDYIGYITTDANTKISIVD